MLNKNQQSCM